MADDPEGLWNFLVELLADPATAAEKVGTPLVVHWTLTGDEPPYGLLGQAFQAALHHGGLRTKEGNGEIPVEWALELYHDIRRSLHLLELWDGISWDVFDEKLSDAGIKFLLDVQSRRA
ncbi:hypothetical protein AB0N65_06885 [Paenarthrobacter sp. NPDC089322]|uniref:hypothetical protein n=1 Tax=Paenarthrobacter sp. NPDC089322 TaxID=3155065 RepID=UPI003432C448